jgi:hypothetical protein
MFFQNSAEQVKPILQHGFGLMKHTSANLRRLELRRDWRIVDRGVNGKPFLWQSRASKKFLMIDIFNPNASKRCYPIFISANNPYSNKKTNRKVIGAGCIERPNESWNDAYLRAKKIAEQYMEDEDFK